MTLPQYPLSSNEDNTEYSFTSIGQTIELFKLNTDYIGYFVKRKNLTLKKINTMKPTTEKNKSKESKPLRNNSTKFSPNNLNPDKLAKANANLKKLDELQQLQKIK